MGIQLYGTAFHPLWVAAAERNLPPPTKQRPSVPVEYSTATPPSRSSFIEACRRLLSDSVSRNLAYGDQAFSDVVVFDNEHLVIHVFRAKHTVISFSQNRHGFGQISRLIRVIALQNGHVIRQQLERNRVCYRC